MEKDTISRRSSRKALLFGRCVGTGVSGFVGCKGFRLAGRILTWCLPLQL